LDVWSLDAATVSQPEAMSFIFICINVGTTKRIIVDTLVQRGVPFVDVGMGVNISDNNGLRGHPARRERRTGWLATQCRSHRSPLKFPANREFYRDFAFLRL
jgi:hypothetical protein